MSNISKRPNEGRIIVSPESIKAISEHPLRLLPESLRPAVLKLHLMHRHLVGLETALPIATMVSVWIADFGLDESDAAQIVNSLCSPDSISRHKFASDVTTELAQRVKESIARRRRSKELEEMRGGSPVSLEQVGIAKIGAMPSRKP